MKLQKVAQDYDEALGVVWEKDGGFVIAEKPQIRLDIAQTPTNLEFKDLHLVAVTNEILDQLPKGDVALGALKDIFRDIYDRKKMRKSSKLVIPEDVFQMLQRLVISEGSNSSGRQEELQGHEAARFRSVHRVLELGPA